MSRLPERGDPIAPHSLSPGELKELLVAARAGKPFLVFRGEERELLISMLDGDAGKMMIGRRSEADLSIPWDAEVSGLHAELERLGGEWTILDDGLSTNGTYLNGERISGRQRLRHEDRIRVGRTVLAYTSAQGAAASATVSAGALAALPELTATQRKVLIALCRPYRDGASFASPATNQEIADELFLSVAAVKMHLRTLFSRFELGDLPQNQKRVRLAESAMQFGLISQRDLA
ncbi:MAG: FHA domain-containing protein [Solirubrobacterales bacterium]